MSNTDDRLDYDRSAPDWRPFVRAPGREAFLALAEQKSSPPIDRIAELIRNHWPTGDDYGIMLCLERALKTIRRRTSTRGSDFITAIGALSPAPPKGTLRVHSTMVRVVASPSSTWDEVTTAVDRILRVLHQHNAVYNCMTVYDALHLRARCLADPESIHPARQIAFVVMDRFGSTKRES